MVEVTAWALPSGALPARPLREWLQAPPPSLSYSDSPANLGERDQGRGPRGATCNAGALLVTWALFPSQEPEAQRRPLPAVLGWGGAVRSMGHGPCVRLLPFGGVCLALCDAGSTSASAGCSRILSGVSCSGIVESSSEGE